MARGLGEDDNDDDDDTITNTIISKPFQPKWGWPWSQTPDQDDLKQWRGLCEPSKGKWWVGRSPYLLQFMFMQERDALEFWEIYQSRWVGAKTAFSFCNSPIAYHQNTKTRYNRPLKRLIYTLSNNSSNSWWSAHHEWLEGKSPRMRFWELSWAMHY